MFRIHYEPKGGYWCVQFHRWGFFWVTVRTREGAGSPLLVKEFPAFSEALKYVEEQGIDEVYRDRTGSPPLAGFDLVPEAQPRVGRNTINSFVRREREFVHTDYAQASQTS